MAMDFVRWPKSPDCENGSANPDNPKVFGDQTMQGYDILNSGNQQAYSS